MEKTSAPLTPKPGFQWSRVVWGSPDAPRSIFCSYCVGKISEDEVPLMLWRENGAMAQFCEKCCETWFGR